MTHVFVINKFYDTGMKNYNFFFTNCHTKLHNKNVNIMRICLIYCLCFHLLIMI
jgi:hypothetical protein